MDATSQSNESISSSALRATLQRVKSRTTGRGIAASCSVTLMPLKVNPHLRASSEQRGVPVDEQPAAAASDDSLGHVGPAEGRFGVCKPRC